jgi:hypothetical protein
MRICLLGLPRCGSQYISRLIASSYSDMTNLAEPFTDNHPYNIVNVRGQIAPYQSTQGNCLYSERIAYVSKVLESGDINQALVLKLFLTDDVYPYLAKILEVLKKLNFIFFIIKRENIEHHLLSHAIGHASNKWNSLQGLHNDNTYHITNTDNIQWLYRTIVNFDNVIREHNITAPIIRYENAVDDLGRLLDMPINTHINIEKQVIGDPYNMINNADEIKQFIKKIINGTKIY